MNIFALQGLGNSGKTATIKQFAKLLEADGAQLERSLKITHAGRAEIAAIYSYKRIKIGVSSAGDTEEILREFAEQAEGTDFCVLACRTRGKAVDYLCEKAGNDLLLFLHKRKAKHPADYAVENEKYARRLFSLIPMFIWELKTNGGQKI